MTQVHVSGQQIEQAGGSAVGSCFAPNQCVTLGSDGRPMGLLVVASLGAKASACRLTPTMATTKPAPKLTVTQALQKALESPVLTPRQRIQAQTMLEMQNMLAQRRIMNLQVHAQHAKLMQTWIKANVPEAEAERLGFREYVTPTPKAAPLVPRQAARTDAHCYDALKPVAPIARQATAATLQAAAQSIMGNLGTGLAKAAKAAAEPSFPQLVLRRRPLRTLECAA